ncbi:MAG TPA: SDR family oxidoreductase [Alicycliphilus sp.]|nr:SDR family oxidoreductase [Alicycliphilus sp.]
MNASFTVRFDGKVCVVTGAAGGIGREIALAFGRVGARVGVLDFNREGAEQTAQLIQDAGGQAVAASCDVSSPASIDGAATAVEQHLGPCDVLVNNAGVIGYGPLESIAEADWARLMSINLSGYLWCSQRFVRGMLQRGGGALVHVASIAANEPHPYCGGYSTSKAGIVMLSQQMAVEWGPQGVRSNCVSPGFVRTPLSDAFYAQEGVTEQRSAMIPSRRIGTPQDLAGPVLFLASDGAAYVNGANLLVDGGLSQASMVSVPRPGYGPQK